MSTLKSEVGSSDHSVLAAFVQKGDCVYGFATYFYAQNSENTWSSSLYASNYGTTKCHCDEVKVACSCALVL